MKISIDKKKQKRIEGAILSLFLCILLWMAINDKFYSLQEAGQILERKYYLFPICIYIILSISISMSILFPVSVISEKVRRYIYGIIIMMLPVISFFIFEYINGGLLNIFHGGIWRFLLNVFIYYAVFCLVAVIIGRIYLAFSFTAILLYILAVMNYFVVQFRGAPVTILDVPNLFTAMSVSGDYNYNFTYVLILSGLIIVLICTWLLQNTSQKMTVISRVLSFALAFSVLTFIHNEVGSTDGVSRYRLNGINFWAFQMGYEQDGYLLSSIELMHYINPKIPSEYTFEKAEKMLSEVTDTIFSKKTEMKDTLPENVIVIMNESFSDLSSLGEFSTSHEITPYLKQLTERTIKGNTMVSAFGGATANSEFEFLTGHSTAFTPAGTIPYQLHIKKGMTSLVSAFKEEGYKTIALHPFIKSNYNRVNVYRNLGFDEYFGGEDFEFSTLRNFVSDQSDFDTVIKLFKDKEKGSKQFLFNVTMQNHGGYQIEDYRSKVALTDYPGKYPQTEQFLTLINETDKAFSYLLDYFSNSDQNTVILMFGDHQPALENEFYEELLGKMNDDTYREHFFKKHITQYVLWSNYDLDMDEIGDTSLNFLGSRLLQTIGVPLGAYNKFLLNVNEVIPALNQFCFLGKDNVAYWNKEDTEYSDIKDKYRLLQYHMMFGN